MAGGVYIEKWEKKEWEFEEKGLKWREAEEMGGGYATMLKPSKKGSREEAKKGG